MGHPLGGASRCPHYRRTRGWYRRPRGGLAHCDCVAAPVRVDPAEFQQGSALNAGNMRPPAAIPSASVPDAVIVLPPGAEYQPIEKPRPVIPSRRRRAVRSEQARRLGDRPADAPRPPPLPRPNPSVIRKMRR